MLNPSEEHSFLQYPLPMEDFILRISIKNPTFRHLCSVLQSKNFFKLINLFTVFQNQSIGDCSIYLELAHFSNRK